MEFLLLFMCMCFQVLVKFFVLNFQAGTSRSEGTVHVCVTHSMCTRYTPGPDFRSKVLIVEYTAVSEPGIVDLGFIS